MKAVFGNRRRAAVLPPLLLLLVSELTQAAGQAADGKGPGAPANCHPDCTKFGNCGEDGQCRCPFGRTGEACEIDYLSPCKLAPDLPAYCTEHNPHSCECFSRCKQYLCTNATEGQTQCWEFNVPQQRVCFAREGVEADKQFSLFPEEKETGARFYSSWLKDGAQEVDRSAAEAYTADPNSRLAPLSKCKSKCNMRGTCRQQKNKLFFNSYSCNCYPGYAGSGCEKVENRCHLQCSGRGTCMDSYCHCQPPYFSIGCSRSKVYPSGHSRPSPVNFKIYMYELNTHELYDKVPSASLQRGDEHHVAYQHFMEQFLLSPVRTEDPSQANLFYIPMTLHKYSGNTVAAQQHIDLVLGQVVSKWPYWNSTKGSNHFYWAPAERGACYHAGLAEQAMKVTHFGLYTVNNSVGWSNDAMSGRELNKDYGCHRPLRDVVAPPYEPHAAEWVATTMDLGVEGIVRGKKSMFFFAGSVKRDDPAYSGNTCQMLSELAKQWKERDFQFVEGPMETQEIERQMRRAKFCLAPYGHGFSARLLQCIFAGSIPVVIQERVFQPLEDVLPYEKFSLRLNNRHLPELREILRSVTEEQYTELVQNLLRYINAFSWDTPAGGTAFQYTILSMRRRWMNFKGLSF